MMMMMIFQETNDDINRKGQVIWKTVSQIGSTDDINERRKSKMNADKVALRSDAKIKPGNESLHFQKKSLENKTIAFHH